jgi:hypothetical protein
MVALKGTCWNARQYFPCIILLLLRYCYFHQLHPTTMTASPQPPCALPSRVVSIRPYLYAGACFWCWAKAKAAAHCHQMDPGEISYLPHHQAPSAVVHAPAIRLLERLSSSRQRANDSLGLWLVCALRPCHKCYTTTDLISELHQGKVVSQAISSHTCVGAQQVQSLFTSQYVQLIPSPISRSRSWRAITPR